MLLLSVSWEHVAFIKDVFYTKASNICIVFVSFLLLLLHLLKHLTPLSPIDQGDDDLIVVHDALEFGRCHLAIAVKYWLLSSIRKEIHRKHWRSFLCSTSEETCRFQHMEYLKTFHRWRNLVRCHNGLLIGHWELSQATIMWVLF